MDVNPQTSFIPKKPLTENNLGNRGLSFFSLISFVVFIVTVLGAGGVYLYEKNLENNNKQLSKNLEDTSSTLDASFINEIVRFNSRIENAKKLMNKHVAITPIFKLLQNRTVSSVTFSNFEFKSNPDNTLNIRMSGAVHGNRDYDSIAQQSDEFAKESMLSDLMFFDLNPDTNGNVSFSFSAKVNPKLTSFQESNVNKAQ